MFTWPYVLEQRGVFLPLTMPLCLLDVFCPCALRSRCEAEVSSVVLCLLGALWPVLVEEPYTTLQKKSCKIASSLELA